MHYHLIIWLEIRFPFPKRQFWGLCPVLKILYDFPQKLPIQKTNATMAVRSALTKEIAVNDALLSVHKKADKDPNVSYFHFEK